MWGCSAYSPNGVPTDAAARSQPQHGRVGACSLLTRRTRQMLHHLLLQQVLSFCECPLWRGLWHSAVLGSTSVAVQKKVVNSHILYPVNVARTLIQIDV